jgi:serine/threonine protein kinase
MANVLQLAMEIVEFPTLSMMEKILNRRQCENLVSNFQNGVQTLRSIANGHNKVFYKAGEDLLQTIHKARVLIEECCKEDWFNFVVMQINNKECFREVLSDFENCFHTMCEIFCHHNPNRRVEILEIETSMTFYPTSIDAVEEDQNEICGRLSKHLDMCTTKEGCKNCKLAQYIKEYMMGLQRVEGGELDKIIFPYNYPRPEYGDTPRRLGSGDGQGGVYLTKWMGLKCATKVMDVCDFEYANKLWKEASILGGLNHPNITKFFCCGFNRVDNTFELVMELGKTSLSQYLNAHGFLKETNAMDIVLQIANGMCYLHDMKVAHRDLKPDNVVVTPPNDSQLVDLGCIHVKLLDFGISKVEVKDSPEVPTGRSKMGTCGYMAPEAMANQLLEVDALKADVFSFGMMCSDILSGTKPSFPLFRDYQVYIQGSKRPKLPTTYSRGLRSLVQDCWSLDPSKRPTFLDIHERLIMLKCSMVKGMFDIGGGTNETSDCLWQMFLPVRESFVSCITWPWLVLQFDHFNNPTSFSSVGPSSNPILSQVNVLLKL